MFLFDFGGCLLFTQEGEQGIQVQIQITTQQMKIITKAPSTKKNTAVFISLFPHNPQFIQIHFKQWQKIIILIIL